MLGLPSFGIHLEIWRQGELLLVGPLVPAWAGVTLAVEVFPLLDAVVDVPCLAYKGLPAELTHGPKELAEVISGCEP